ncbi:MAG: hypothetical protein AAF851_11080 [Myxococcota bacterium]
MLIATFALSAAAGQCFHTVGFSSPFDPANPDPVEAFEKAGFEQPFFGRKIYGSGTAFLDGQVATTVSAADSALEWCQSRFPLRGYDCVDNIAQQNFLPPLNIQPGVWDWYAAYDVGSSSWLQLETQTGLVGPFPGLTGFSCGYQTVTPGQPPGPIPVRAPFTPAVVVLQGGGSTPGFDLTVKSTPNDGVEWGMSETVTVTIEPDPGFSGSVEVTPMSVTGENVKFSPETQSVPVPGGSDVDVTFDIQPADRDSRLGCIDVEVFANGGTSGAAAKFESRVRPVDGGFTKVFDATTGSPNNFVGNADQTCSTPNLPTQISETVEADATPNGVITGPFTVEFERNNQGPRSSSSVTEYALLPAAGFDGCAVGFVQQANFFNWHTFGFARRVAPSEITSREVSDRFQSLFPNVDQIWMAPDSTAHVQITDLDAATGLRTAKAFDNITGDSGPGGTGQSVCPDVTSIRREGDNIIVESRRLGPNPDPCDDKIFTPRLPGGTDCP